MKKMTPLVWCVASCFLGISVYGMEGRKELISFESCSLEGKHRGKGDPMSLDPRKYNLEDQVIDNLAYEEKSKHELHNILSQLQEELGKLKKKNRILEETNKVLREYNQEKNLNTALEQMNKIFKEWGGELGLDLDPLPQFNFPSIDSVD